MLSLECKSIGGAEIFFLGGKFFRVIYGMSPYIDFNTTASLSAVTITIEA